MPGRRPWRRAPHWWPEGEPWPPPRPPWRKMKGRFFLRAGVWLALTFFLSVTACTLTLYFTAGLFQDLQLPLGGALVGLAAGTFVLLLVFALGARGLRRLAAPLGGLLEASGRVAEGDYAVRVPERGAPEVRSLARAFNTMTARLQSHDERRRDLLADITHELRTPLTVIQGNLEAMLDGVYPRDEAHLERVLEETRLLSRLLEDLRTLALAESGALALRKEPTDLAALASETAAAFRPQADAAGVRLIVDDTADLPWLEVDPSRMREVLSNLITNSLNYTPEGGEVRVACSAGEDGWHTLTVSDTGSGIAPEDLPHIFDRFYRAAGSPGSGLGLAIAKDLVEAHDGEIEASSRPGEGTRIEVRLPAGSGSAER